MGPLDLLNHLLNFAAPALFVGFFLALVTPKVLRKGARKPPFAVRAVVNSTAGLCAMAAGLWFFGNDGKMASYLALVLAAALSQLVLMQPSR